MMDPNISPTEETILKKSDYIRRKIALLKKQINDYNKTLRTNDKEAYQASQKHFFKNIQFIKYPQDKEYRKLLFGLALYGIELIKKSETNPAAKKEILSFMERCDKYYKEQNADMDHLPDEEDDDDEEDEEIDEKPVPTVNKNPPSAPKPVPSNSSKATPKIDNSDVLIDDDGNILA